MGNTFESQEELDNFLAKMVTIEEITKIYLSKNRKLT